MATHLKDLVLHSPAGSTEVVTFAWPLQIGHGQDKHDNGIDIIETIKFVCNELPSLSSAFEEINFSEIDTACYKTMTNIVDRFNKAVDSIVALEKGTSLPAERLNKFAHPNLLKHILQLVYNAAVLDPDKLNQYEPFSPEVYGETSYELVAQMIKNLTISNDDTFIDLGSGVGQVVLQMAGSFPLKTCIGIEKADTPAAYAERMDIIFRQYMAWFGKRYCEYKLIKGDFLVDEHREKITSSTLVFVNNFAFGPNVDHQLKERFADLRDGARVVSSKSFCPLNFRITDRNLSDIGTIMHVSEIPPLKGSVSWTCKPVSYYMHVIDRTILERYFQRLKTKGADNEHVGSVRTTRDRAKREAHNHSLQHNNHQQQSQHNNHNHQNNNNSNSNSSSNSSAHSRAHLTHVNKTRQQQQQHQSRNMDLDTSTESDGDAVINVNINGDMGGGSGSNTTNNVNGPTTRKVWSDWCSSKGKSSQSDDEENNNFSSTTNSRNARATTQKKRKKLTRKAAIASKSVAAAHDSTNNATCERDIQNANSVNNSKESSSKEDNGSNSGTTTAITVRGGRKGRLKKGARGRKSLKIAGLDVLHKQTLLSTSVEAMCKKLPAAPGTVDQQLTSLLTDDMSHTELDIPAAPQDTPYGLEILLDLIRTQYMAIVEQMKSKSYAQYVAKTIKEEQERNERIKSRVNQLTKQIKVLIDDSVALLKVRLNELGINVAAPNDLISKAKEIVSRHKDLQNAASKVRIEVTLYEAEQRNLLKQRISELSPPLKLNGTNGKIKTEMPCDLSESAAEELLLREITNTMQQRKRLIAQVSYYDKEINALEKAVEEQRTTASLLAQGTNITPLAITTATTAPVIQQPLQLTTTTVVATSGATATVVNNSNNNNKSSTIATSKYARRNREHRARSQEWPDVPDVGKIEESNPEVLAQKILETGRQIEAGKFMGANNNNNNISSVISNSSSNNNNNTTSNGSINVGVGKHAAERKQSHQMPAESVYMNTMPQDSALMPAPIVANKQQLQQQQQHQVANSMTSATSSKLSFGLTRNKPAHNAVSNLQESPPKLVNFEHRLKSIIKSALSEDQEQCKPTTEIASKQPQTVTVAPLTKRCKTLAAVNLTSAINHMTTAATATATSASATAATNNVHNIITVATQGLMHLNANTTISPVTPPLPAVNAAAAAAVPPSSNTMPCASNVTISGAYCKPAGGKQTGSATHKYAKEAAKYQQQQMQQQQSAAHLPPAALYTVTNTSATAAVDLAYQRRRRTSYEQFLAQQQQQHQQQQHQQQQQQHQQHALLLAAASAHQHQQQQQQQHQYQHQFQHNVHPHHNHHHHQHQHQQQHPLEFKAPTASNREQMDELLLPPRSSSAHSDSAIMHYAPINRIERSISRESAISQPLTLQHTNQSLIRPPSRPSSNCSQPDYTQVSPAKMALRRHLSQEKLHQQTTTITTTPIITATQQPTPPPSVGAAAVLSMSTTKTIGDLVNGEIERTLEISHQSIINAAVNMSTVAQNNATKAAGGTSAHFMERTLFPERECLLINPNAERPERVHVRVHATEESPPAHAAYAPLDVTTRGGRKSPFANNLATLAHVASYNHKHLTDCALSLKVNSTTTTTITLTTAAKTTATATATPYSSRSNNNRTTDVAPSQHQPACHQSMTPNIAGRGVTGSRGRDYQTVVLPRAEMKGCIEAYFHEEQQQQQQLPSKACKERNSSNNGSVRATRHNGANPPLEGLAASLQDHVLARKNEERQRRAAAAAAINTPELSVGQHSHHYGDYHQSTAANQSNLNGTPPQHNKIEIGVKRTSPLATAAHQPRPSKMPHYAPDVMLQHNPYAHTNGGYHHHHNHQQQQRPTLPVSPTPTLGRRGNKLTLEPMLMSPENNSILNEDRPLQLSTTRQQYHQQQHNQYTISGQQLRHQKHTSITTNSLISGGNSSSARAVTIVAATNAATVAAAADDDDVIAADDETHWQHRVSSGFDRLVAFASTELDKTRRSIDTIEIVPASISCNTSPDSGITHSSTNSDAARTFLSNSSISSQLDLPISSGGSSSSSGSSGIYSHHSNQHHHHTGSSNHASDHLSDSSMKSSHSDATSSLHATTSLKISSPVDPSAIESPPLSDIGLPRTPSPNAAAPTPPLSILNNNSNNNNNTDGNTLKIPLKYQRKSKLSSEKHYKKKFCERNWEYDCDELLTYSNGSLPGMAADSTGNIITNGPAINDNCSMAITTSSTTTMKTGKSPKDNLNAYHNTNYVHVATTVTTTTNAAIVTGTISSATALTTNPHHKSSKFRPKGKDWDWSLDSNSNKGKTEPIVLVNKTTTMSN